MKKGRQDRIAETLTDEYGNEKTSLHPQTVYSSRVQKKSEGD
jgi:hypothetical protein